MLDYRSLGLVNTRGMLRRAYEGGYAVPALYFISAEQVNAIFDAAGEEGSPVILLASPNLRGQLGGFLTARMVQGAVERLRAEGLAVEAALHLDHGKSYQQCVEAIEGGFSSVMIDGSALPFEENIALTRRVVEYAHRYDVTVEAELGALGDEHLGADSLDYTDPERAAAFVRATGVDSLAMAVGTCHGMVKLRPGPDGRLPELRYDLLARTAELLPGFPIVLHGASCLPPECVAMVNRYGGRIPAAAGIPEEQVARAAGMNVCKVNIASDGWITAMAHTRRVLAENPGAIDCRVFTGVTRGALRELYRHKMQLLGSAGRLGEG